MDALQNRAAAQEEAARDEYDSIVLNLRQQHMRGMQELDITQVLRAFKRKLLKKINDMFLMRAAEVPRLGPTFRGCSFTVMLSTPTSSKGSHGCPVRVRSVDCISARGVPSGIQARNNGVDDPDADERLQVRARFLFVLSQASQIWQVVLQHGPVVSAGEQPPDSLRNGMKCHRFYGARRFLASVATCHKSLFW